MSHGKVVCKKCLLIISNCRCIPGHTGVTYKICRYCSKKVKINKEDKDVKKMYLILKHGVYIQGVCGIFDTLEKAINNAKIAIAKERDDYHSFAVYKCYPNKLIEIEDDVTKPLALITRIFQEITIRKTYEK